LIYLCESTSWQGQRWTRKMTPSLLIIRNEINALGNFRGGGKLGRDFAAMPHQCGITKPRHGGAILYQLQTLGEPCSPKAKVRGSNPLGRASKIKLVRAARSRGMNSDHIGTSGPRFVIRRDWSLSCTHAGLRSPHVVIGTVGPPHPRPVAQLSRTGQRLPAREAASS
jgi:hypothetical protein